MDPSIGRKRLWAAMRAEEDTASGPDGEQTSVHSKLDNARPARLPGDNRWLLPTPSVHGVVEQYRPQMYGRPLGQVRTPASRGCEVPPATVLSTATLAPGATQHAFYTQTGNDGAGIQVKSFAGPGTSVVTSIAGRPPHGGSTNPFGQASIGHHSAHSAADLSYHADDAFQRAQSGQLGPVTRDIGPQQVAGGANAQEYPTQQRGIHAWPPRLISHVHQGNFDQGGGIRDRPLETPQSSFTRRASAQVAPIQHQPAQHAASMPLVRYQRSHSDLLAASGEACGPAGFSNGRMGPVAEVQQMSAPQHSSSGLAVGINNKFGNTTSMHVQQSPLGSSRSSAAGPFRGVQMPFGGARRFPVAALQGQVLSPAWQLLADDARSRATGAGFVLRSRSARGVSPREGVTWGQAPRQLGPTEVPPRGRQAPWVGGAAHMPRQSDQLDVPPPLKHPRVSMAVRRGSLVSQGIALQGVPAALPGPPRVSAGQGSTHGGSRAPDSGSMARPEHLGPPPSSTPALIAPLALTWSAGSGAADSLQHGVAGDGLPTGSGYASVTTDMTSSTRAGIASNSRAAVQQPRSHRRIRSDGQIQGPSEEGRRALSQAWNRAVEPQEAGAPGMVELSEVMRQVPAEWGRKSSKIRWFRHVMGSNRHGSSAVAMRRSKTAEVIRLFDDFDFSIRCSTELLRRGCRGSIEVVPSNPPSSSSSSSSSASAGVRIRLLKDFSYTEVEGWAHGDGAGKWQVLLEDQCIDKPHASTSSLPQVEAEGQAGGMVSHELGQAGPQGQIQGKKQGQQQARANSSSSSSSTARGQGRAAAGTSGLAARAADICFVPPDPAGRQVRGYQLYIVFRPVGATTRRPKQYRTPVQRGVSVAKLLRGGTERRTSICAKLRSVTSPDPNGDEDVLQWIDELVKYGII